MKVIYKETNKLYKKDMENKKYYLNNEEMKKDDDSEFKIDDFKNAIKKDIANFIYPFENIVVLAGAGASVVMKEDGSPDDKYGLTVAMLAKKVNIKLKSNDKFLSIETLSKICHYNVNKEYSDEFNRSFNLEDFLSNALTYSNFLPDNKKIICDGTEYSKKEYDESLNEILEIIKTETSYEFNETDFKHGKFIKVLSEMHKTPNRLTIVTTNYDTLFEDAANKLNFTVFDGFTFTHNPSFDISMFDWDMSRTIKNVKTNKVEYKKSIINLLKIHGSLTWGKENEKLIRKEKKDITNPIMIFPSTNKYMHSYENPYFELFSKFQELLRKPNSVLITTGFSFADNHISKMIFQALKNNPSLSVLATDYNIEPENPNNNWKELNDLQENGYSISFLNSTFNSDLMDYIEQGYNYDR